jgi:hypothetical protein
MRFILVVLLIVFLTAFFGIDRFVDWFAGDAQDAQIKYLEIPLSSPQIRIFLGLGTVFLEFAIILFSMLDRIVDTIRETIKPLARLIPLGAFLISIYQTFAPLLTNSVSMEGAGPAVRTSNLVNIVNDNSFSEGILLTVFTMLLFLVADRALRSESEEVKALKAELAKYRRALR